MKRKIYYDPTENWACPEDKIEHYIKNYLDTNEIENEVLSHFLDIFSKEDLLEALLFNEEEAEDIRGDYDDYCDKLLAKKREAIRNRLICAEIEVPER